MDKEVVRSKLCCCGLSVFLAHSSARPHTVAGGNAQGRKKHVPWALKIQSAASVGRSQFTIYI